MSTSQLFVIAIFLFGSSLHGLSQRLVEDGKQWNIVVYPTFSPNTTSSSLRIQGDTTIDNVAYKRLMLSRDSFNTAWKILNQYLREDSTKKVFLKVSNSPEQVLYDFSLVPGDTFYIDNYCQLRVLTTDTVTLDNGAQRKRLKVSSIYSDFVSWEFDYWIEGIGSTRGGLLSHFSGHCATDYSAGLLCYYEGGELVFRNHPNSCFITPVQELSINDHILLFPNPFNHKIVIQDKSKQNKIRSIGVYNAVGQWVFSKQIEHLPEHISTIGLAKGIYYLVVYLKDGNRLSKKMIKQ